MEKAKCRLLVFLIIFSLHPLFLAPVFWPYINNFQESGYQEAFSSWVAGLGFKGILILFGLQMLRVIIPVIPGGPMQIISGAAYGAWGGLLVSAAGCAAATVIVFLMVRKFGRRFIIRFFGANILNSWGFLSSEKKTSLVIFILFLFPGVPKDTLTYLVPLTRLSLIQFTVISLVARFPAMLLSTSMGDAAMQGNWLLFLLLFGLTALFGILGIQLRERMIPLPGSQVED